MHQSTHEEPPRERRGKEEKAEGGNVGNTVLRDLPCASYDEIATARLHRTTIHCSHSHLHLSRARGVTMTRAGGTGASGGGGTDKENSQLTSLRLSGYSSLESTRAFIEDAEMPLGLNALFSCPD